MKFGLKSGLCAVGLLTLTAPAFALNPQPEPPGVHHDLNMSIQNSSRTLTAPVSNTCGAASGRPNVVAGGTQSAGSMSARGGGGDVGNGVFAHGDKCAKAASTMAPAAPAAH